MREVLYKYDNLGAYTTGSDTTFGDDSHLKIIVEPHDFSIAVAGEVLRSTSCKGYIIVAYDNGETVFCDNEGNVVARAEKGEKCYKEVILNWKQDILSVEFGYTDVIDYYPNCDGEYDRWEKKWVAQRTVTLNAKNNSVEVN